MANQTSTTSLRENAARATADEHEPDGVSAKPLATEARPALVRASEGDDDSQDVDGSALEGIPSEVVENVGAYDSDTAGGCG